VKQLAKKEEKNVGRDMIWWFGCFLLPWSCAIDRFHVYWKCNYI